MGLFGGLRKRLKDGRILDGFAAAQAALAGDGAAMAQINALTRQRLAETRQREAMATALLLDPNIPPHIRQLGREHPELIFSAIARSHPGFLYDDDDDEDGGRDPVAEAMKIPGFTEGIPGFAGAIESARDRDQLPVGTAYRAPDQSIRRILP